MLSNSSTAFDTRAGLPRVGMHRALYNDMSIEQIIQDLVNKGLTRKQAEIKVYEIVKRALNKGKV